MLRNVSRLHGGCPITETGCCDRDSWEARPSQPGWGYHTQLHPGLEWKQPQEPHAAGPGTGLGLYDTQELHWVPGTVRALCDFVGVQVGMHWGSSGLVLGSRGPGERVLGLRGLPFLCSLYPGLGIW